MMEQFLKSILAYFNTIEPVTGNYIQKIPEGVQYPCYLVNKVDVNTKHLTNYLFTNTVTPYIRLFSEDEVDMKNKAFNLVTTIHENLGKIPVLDTDGTLTGRLIRVDAIESYEIVVDVNEIYCVEITFSFDTQFNISSAEFSLLQNIITNYNN